jgi:hypothetical protein
VANVDDADVFVETAVVDGLDVPAAQREDVRRAVTFQCLGDEAPSMDQRHAAQSIMQCSVQRQVASTNRAFRSSNPRRLVVFCATLSLA